MEAIEWLRRRGLAIVLAGATVLLLGYNWHKVTAFAASAGGRPAQASERPASRGVHAEGRLATYPGALVTVGTDVGGTLRSLPVLEKAHVKKGDLVAEIDASEEVAALNEARARVREAEVDMRLFEVELRRSQSLFATNAVSKDAVDRSEHDLNSAKARRDTGASAARKLEAIVNKTRIVSPIDGVVVARLSEAGQTVAAGAQLVTVADLSRTRIEAEVDEYDAGRIAVGADVAIGAEGYGDRVWRGTVEEIPDQVTPRQLKPQDPGRPSDTRVLMVKIVLAEATPIKLGQRVEVQIAATPR
jgi:HlyD family secretion protein